MTPESEILTHDEHITKQAGWDQVTIPAAFDLISGKFLRPPRTARGIYLDRLPERKDIHMSFVWESPGKWVWMHKQEPTAGAITDGTTNVIVEDGVAVLITDEGEVGTTHRLMNLLNPMWIEWDSEFSNVTSGEAIGRPAWLVSATPRRAGKIPVDLAFDQGSAVLLYMKGSGFYMGFEELELDEELSDETFRWDGQIEPRKVGTATVARDHDGSYSVWWEVSVRRRSMFNVFGGRQLTKEKAVAWGEERAARIYVRPE